MGAAMIKSCFAGGPVEDPHRHYHHYTRSLANTMPPSLTPPDAHKRLGNRLFATDVEVPVKKHLTRRAVNLPQTAVRLQQLDQDISKLRKSLASSISSDATTMSESSFVAMSPPQEIDSMRGYYPMSRTSTAKFRALLPDNYVLECVAGKGTTCICFKSVRKSDGRRFACKIIEKRTLAPSSRKRMEVAAQLRREVDVLRRVDHPHITKLEEFFEDDNYLILIMELMEGGELFDAIIEKGRFSEKEAVHVARSILSAIHHMHDRGIMHRDLKPENMLLTQNEKHHGVAYMLNVKVIDFGFAKILKDGARSISFLGTGGYLAPEILLRQAYGTSVDMWSFGVLTYLLLCGRLPFPAITKLRRDQRIQSLYKLTFPRKYWHGVSPVAIDFLRRVLVLDPYKRMTADEALNHAWIQG
ncbi:camk protein kinase [Plasmopara halstedii]|uniref:Camk protein kinase n=1 Tax=Plasmopara halstedii TaxID=4781 RepID=A0A0P1AX53_PLAHL|nr:camk protein kinase [Plasmopara halstedii]CEG45994.1 camk protein kinase [Plasmopara halstedii]|eukprot:XP_024582363.1 camk protein kinase [Plasmopara halstedii]